MLSLWRKTVLQREKGVMKKDEEEGSEKRPSRERKRRGTTTSTVSVKPAASKVTVAAVAEGLEAVGKHTFSVEFGPGRERC